MRKRDAQIEEHKPIGRLMLILVGVLFLSTGAGSLLRGRSHYPNYWGAPVFAPFTILLGLLSFVAAVRLKIERK